MVTRPVVPPPPATVPVTTASLERLVAIAAAAGEAIMAHYRGGVAVTHKADRSPVTAADRAAHDVIVAALAAWTPGVPVISEEGRIPPVEERRDWVRFWLVDPLDGTKEFLQRNGEFTVNIALIERGEPVLGVVAAPALGRSYHAGRGLGAFRQDGPAPSRAIWSAPPSPDAPLRVVESRSHPSAELERWLRGVTVAERIAVGSSLKFCLLAEGRADVYPRFGRTMEWDVAAGDCIFRWSGRDGPRRSPLRYNTPGLDQPGFLIGLGD